jgi:hypothetical protein
MNTGSTPFTMKPRPFHHVGLLAALLLLITAGQSRAELSAEAREALHLSPNYILWLSILATAGLVSMWTVFWWAVTKAKESVHDVLLSVAFFRTVTVMGVIAATVVLSLAGRLAGNITGAILSGVVGYVLGQISGRGHGQAAEKGKKDLEEPE